MKKQLLKRADIMEWAGISIMQYRKLLEARILRPAKIRGYKQNIFRRSEVRTALQLDETL